jgi:hypothetical protein
MDDLAFHVLELQKFTRSAAELAPGLDIWLYFLRHVEKMNTRAGRRIRASDGKEQSHHGEHR